MFHSFVMGAPVELSALIWDRSVTPICVAGLFRRKRCAGGNKKSRKHNGGGYADLRDHCHFSLQMGATLAAILFRQYRMRLIRTMDFLMKVPFR